MRFFFLLVAFVFSLNFSSAQVEKPVKWTWSYEHVSGDEYVLIFKAAIKEHWSVYSQYLKGDGPIPTSFEYDDAGKHFELIGKNEESGHKKSGYDKVFDMEVTKFKDHATFKQHIKVKDYSKPIVGYLTFMTCDDTKCLPPTDVDFSFTIKKKSEPVLEKKDIPDTHPKKTTTTKATSGKKEPNKKATKKQKSKTKTAIKEQKTPPAFKDAQPAKKKNGIQDPVKWTYTTKKISDSEYDLIFTATMEPHWTIYSQFTEENGPVPTYFEFTKGDHYQTIGKVKEHGKKKEGKDPMFGVNVIKYVKSPVTFTQRVKVTDPSKPITGYVSFMSCNDKMCLPPKDVDFSFSLDGKSSTAKEGNPTANIAKTPVTKHHFDKELATSSCSNEQPEDENPTSWWLIFLLGVGGGLIAILTPCVFPMIPLTVSFFTKSSKDKKSGLRNALYYGLSIIVIYVSLGLLVTGIFGADALNLLSTNVWFNLGFALLFIVFAFSFFGYFEITLPSSWANKTDKMSDKGGLIGIFFMAFTLSLVSFSCTGPIIGTLLVQAAQSGFAGPFFGMLGFSIALAFPFGLFAMFPGWLNSLPKSGGWMNTVKVTLGFVEIAFALKFISIADLTMGWKIMPYELFVGLWVLIALLLSLYYFKVIKFKLDGKEKPSVARIIAGGLMLVLAGYFATGFMYDSRSETFKTPNLLSGLAPPPGHSYIYPKHCPLNINCFHDFDEGLAYAKQQNKPVLLDFTGYGCVNCRRMEDNVWSNPDINNIIVDKYVLISLYVDDRKKLDKPYISAFSNRKMRTVGNKWADFQATHFDRNSQPYYVLLTPEKKVLNNPVAYTPEVEEYKAFLECGLKRFEEQKHK